jgi:protein TonB
MRSVVAAEWSWERKAHSAAAAVAALLHAAVAAAFLVQWTEKPKPLAVAPDAFVVVEIVSAPVPVPVHAPVEPEPLHRPEGPTLPPAEPEAGAPPSLEPAAGPPAKVAKPLPPPRRKPAAPVPAEARMETAAGPAEPQLAALSASPAPAPMTATPVVLGPIAPEPFVPPDGRAGYLSNPKPAYPPAARKRGLEGLVVLAVEVDADGRPFDVTVKESSGHPMLDNAALGAVRRWRFEPARRAGRPVRAGVEVPIRFRLEES